MKIWSRAALGALVIATGACDFGFNDTPDAGPSFESGFDGRLQVYTAQSQSADQGEMVREQRRLVQLAQDRRARALGEQGHRETDSQTVQTTPGTLRPLGRAGSLRVVDPPERASAPRIADWSPGSLVLSVEQGRFSPRAVRDLTNTMLDAQGFVDVIASEGTCVARTLCRVTLRSKLHGKLVDKTKTKEIEQALNRNRLPGIVVVSANYLHHAMRFPNDEYYQFQRWHYEWPNLPAAWDITTGDPNIVIAVVDTGVNLAHPDWGNRLAQGIDMISNLEISGDQDGRDTNPTDPGVQTGYHGTHVAGTLGAASNNGVGVSGVTWQGSVQPVRVLGNGTAGEAFDILSGVYWAVGEQDFTNEDGTPSVPILNSTPARVVNLSLGAPFEQNDYDVWVNQVAIILGSSAALYDYPILVVAAGNENQDASFITPANIDALITVAAHRVDGQRAPYSNFGNVIDLVAPGGQADLDQNSDSYGDGVLSLIADDYNFEQGTSMAAPHVAGIAALLLAVDPTLTQADVTQLLRSTATPVPTGYCPEGCGNGYVDAAQALLTAGGTVSPTPYLAVESTLVIFDTGVNATDFRILNLGEAPAPFELEIVGPQASYFNVSPSSGSVPGAGTTVVSVTVNRQQAESATANLALTGGGDALGQQFFVKLFFNDRAIPPRYELLAAEVGAYRINDDNSYTQVGESTIARRNTNFEFELRELPEGEYYLFAVGDDNGDGVYDPTREAFGGWPLSSSVEPIFLEANTVVAGVAFPLSGGFVLDYDEVVGNPCTVDEDCNWADGACILPGPLWTAGYCSRLCSDGSCGAGASCEALTCEGEGDCGVCLKSCTSSTQCRQNEGYECDCFFTCSPIGFSECE